MRRVLQFVLGDRAIVSCPVCGGDGDLFPQTGSTTMTYRCWFCLGRGTVTALPNHEQYQDTSA